MNSSKVVLITGATAGIGLSIAQFLHNQGHIVYGTGRTAHGLASEGFQLLSMDQQNTSSIDLCVSKIIAEHSKIDILINNAGIGMAGPIEEISEESALSIFNINLIGIQRVCNAVLPYMRKQRQGTIINVSSIAAEMGLPFRAHYCSSKAATEGFSEALSMEVRSFGINVVVIQPGDMKTSINKNRVEIDATKDSPYYSAYKHTREKINNAVEHGANPIVIAHLVNKIINKKNPRFKYRVGGFLEKLAVFVKNVLPYRWYESLMMNYYKIK